ncbi:MAG: glycosyltransferase family 4 protein, partial [Pseudomonadota bacterium]
KDPYIIRCVGDDIQKMPEINYGMRLNPLVERLFKKYFIHAPSFIATTHSIKREYLDLNVPEQKIKTILNGVDIERLQHKNKPDDIRRIFGFAKDDFILLALGRNHPKKNFKLAIEMFQSLPQDYIKKHKLKLLIVGRGVDALSPFLKDEDHIILQDPAMLKNNITAHQDKKQDLQLPDDFIVSCYQASNLFLMTSFIETFGIVLIESMAAGLPIISTKVKGCVDVLRGGKDAILIESNSIKQLKQAVQKLVENKSLLLEYQNKSRHRANHFCWTNIVDEYINIYKEILEK